MNASLQLYTRLRVGVDPHTGAGWYVHALLIWSRGERRAPRLRLLQRSPEPYLRDALNDHADDVRIRTNPYSSARVPLHGLILRQHVPR